MSAMSQQSCPLPACLSIFVSMHKAISALAIAIWSNTMNGRYTTHLFRVVGVARESILDGMRLLSEDVSEREQPSPPSLQIQKPKHNFGGFECD